MKVSCRSTWSSTIFVYNTCIKGKFKDSLLFVGGNTTAVFSLNPRPSPKEQIRYSKIIIFACHRTKYFALHVSRRWLAQWQLRRHVNGRYVFPSLARFLVEISSAFFFICFYWFQPVLYRLGIPRGIYRDVYSELFTEMFTVYPILPLSH